MSEKITYFPFAPGIPYRTKKGYIVPKLDGNSWNRAFNDKTAIFVSNGGFLESVYSLPLLEVVNFKLPKQKLQYMCNDFSHIFDAQGLTTKCEYNLSKEVLKKYPAPLFLDKNNNIYVNCLNSYINIHDYYGDYKYHDTKAVGFQIFKNIMVPWDYRYIPNLRNLECPEELSLAAKVRKINLEHKYILMIPDKTGLSKHGASCLGWNIHDIRSFSAMIARSGYKLIILTSNPQKYYGINAFISSTRLDFLLYLLVNANIVLSEEVDFLLASLLLGNAKTFSKETFDEFKINKNKKFFRVESSNISMKNVTPLDVFGEL